ncbi:hypothetical protein K488DRAFT_43772 [Vararia minispora EC-137]|uniref:Uncharacterized protein n=1 Tax=Vararia minispora EC-137 TaxID=1314806 RepID=A0ACB8QTL3_9AGAM|nr:hypothetical protein K488DRAFT_43772 [Vararia minispora EC-137]
MSTVSTLASDALSNPLVVSLNKLVTGLGLPFELETPLDLTPSLLLAILESLLENRLPIAQPVRESRDQSSRVAAMKIFLGVLEHDVIRQDVGLSDIDPRRLAAGNWEEIVFIGELLCWLGKQMGFLRSSHASSSALADPPPEHSLPLRANSRRNPSLARSPSALSASVDSALAFVNIDDGSNITEPSVSYKSGQVAALYPQQSPRRRVQPMCIHELEDPSFLGSVRGHALDHGSLARDLSEGDVSSLFCSCADDCSDLTSPSIAASSIRYDGYMELVDEEAEVEAFERHRAIDSRMCSTQSANPAVITPPANAPGKRRVLTKHTSPTQHTLALLNERARLLSELASLDLAHRD